MVLSWYYHNISVVLSWYYLGIIMVLSWYYRGIIMVLSWYYHGIIMVLSWYYHCIILVLSWYELVWVSMEFLQGVGLCGGRWTHANIALKTAIAVLVPSVLRWGINTAASGN